jgi:hypothetical protein
MVGAQSFGGFVRTIVVGSTGQIRIDVLQVRILVSVAQLALQVIKGKFADASKRHRYARCVKLLNDAFLLLCGFAFHPLAFRA